MESLSAKTCYPAMNKIICCTCSLWQSIFVILFVNHENIEYSQFFISQIVLSIFLCEFHKITLLSPSNKSLQQTQCYSVIDFIPEITKAIQRQKLNCENHGVVP